MSNFSDSAIQTIKYNSNWKDLNSKKEKKNIRCQTDIKMVNWELDSDMQTGIKLNLISIYILLINIFILLKLGNQYMRGTEVDILQGEVDSNTTLLKYMTTTKPFSTQNHINKESVGTNMIDDRKETNIDDFITNNIISGQVSVDCEICTDPKMFLEADSFVELVDLHRDISVG
jgi:hypothetical protein